METSSIPPILQRCFHCGQLVRWRNPEQANAYGWMETYGSGPFEVLFVIDKRWQDLPDGLIVKTMLGEREINSIWLAPVTTGIGSGPSI